MSVEVTLEIPLDVAFAIREINFELERLDGDVEFALATITNDVIRAIKSLLSDNMRSPLSRFSSASQHTSTTEWPGPRSCSTASARSTTSSDSSMSTDSMLGVHVFPEFSIIVENEYGYTHRLLATGDMTIADLERILGPLCGFEPTWQSLTWHGYRINQPHATLSSYGIDRYPYIEIRRKSNPAFDEQTLVVLREPRLPPRALPVPPPLPPR
ncbi:hypothetical protein CERZMDRAFT_92711 [Cercospora zeae-maydis SCOH1-5]|uniref:Ubiquitin-like domain-containing protein n=1 Tax=Cercospora zeae-maydis SCOH1-5 TaxID=717836 RepID=A0A6A6FXE5_9PEZI|nr:hypothetical protein CERZMDRAFT_92711 [Cercospora zeae-maydis SCOH1-5]